MSWKIFSDTFLVSVDHRNRINFPIALSVLLKQRGWSSVTLMINAPTSCIGISRHAGEKSGQEGSAIPIGWNKKNIRITIPTVFFSFFNLPPDTLRGKRFFLRVDHLPDGEMLLVIDYSQPLHKTQSKR